MKPKKGDTVELLKCVAIEHQKHKFKGETGVVKRVYGYDDIALTKPASCGCRAFTPNEYKIISKKEVKMDRIYEFSKDGLKVGDIVVNKNQYKTKVIEVLENSFARSNWDDFNSGCHWYHFNDTIECDWTIEQPVKPKSKATLKKIAEAKKYLKEQGELND